MIQELVPNHASVAADDRCLSAVLDRPMATFFHHEEAAKAEYFVLLEDGWNTAPADIAKLVGALKLQHNLELLKHDFGVYVLKRRPTPTADSAPE